MRVLQLGFKTESGKKRSLSLKYVDQNLDAANVRKQMQAMAAAKLFMQDGEEVYFEPLSAKYVETNEVPLF
ncbi:MAG: DUF2922 domain-containing protein [Lactobacillus sp.]|uniref:DUF2922 domain-containing protein n=1 Tax=Bombilactobacillus bombi TaxID=1303590 RepID=A0A347SU75_9LACO|nr:DUF2922 domain-containing protein [Bombilactobacillus bombi]MCO6540905.1 DUF2922 domain-containing protein [Lactobacillus sp.]AXX65584.1 DUF2922 domain-containing protein [Bombilactobacillus bombi]MCO6542552.1 DUF2922 domain-containing protein [Lactobacillus sp.]RHW47836.1 DUF2922 domain-containing protein [Bombilactobacillus bombi]RHW52015.1 DUF2922 domain-containing protein [Bombilactobacillus bombi]